MLCLLLSPIQGSRGRRTSGMPTDESGTDDPSYSPTMSRSKRKGRGRPGRPRKRDLDTSQSSPTRKRKKRLTVTSNDQTDEKQEAGSKKSTEKSKSDETSPDDAVKVPDSGLKSKAKKSAAKRKRTSKQSKEKSDRKAKPSTDGVGSDKKNKSKKKLSTDDQGDTKEIPTRSKEKGKESKKQIKTSNQLWTWFRLRSGSVTLFLQFQVNLWFFFPDCYWTRNVIRYNKNVYKLNVLIYRKGCVHLMSKKLEPILKKVQTRGRCC